MICDRWIDAVRKVFEWVCNGGHVPRLNAGTHLLTVIEGDDEWPVSAVFSVDDQTSEDDGDAW